MTERTLPVLFPVIPSTKSHQYLVNKCSINVYEKNDIDSAGGSEKAGKGQEGRYCRTFYVLKRSEVESCTRCKSNWTRDAGSVFQAI